MKLSSPKIDSLLFAVASSSVLRFGMSPFADASTRQILPVTFSARFRADLEDFLPVKILAELREDRLSGKKCTFDHSVLFGYNFTGH